MLTVKTLSEINQIIKDYFGNIQKEYELVSMENALNRVLWQDICAEEYVPGFDRATVDGYAVKASDVFGCSESIPALLRLIGESVMGEQSNLTIQPGECVYVPTGGEVPQGADAMVMLEQADNLGGGQIAIYKAAAPGANMIFRGDDVRPGQVVLPRGRLLNVADTGALATMGIVEVAVYQRPKVGIISTGDEIIPPEANVTAGKIRDVNAPMLINATREVGGEPNFYGIIKDQEDQIRMTLEKAISQNDIVLLSGGTSVGTKDTAPKIIQELGKLLVHGAAVKPGKPTIVGMINQKPVFGLPGNPVAAYFMFTILVRPLIGWMIGTNLPDRSVQLPISRTVPSNHGREELVPIMIKDNLAVPIASKSGLITTLANADGFIRIARDLEGLRQGEMVDVILFTR